MKKLLSIPLLLLLTSCRDIFKKDVPFGFVHTKHTGEKMSVDGNRNRFVFLFILSTIAFLAYLISKYIKRQKNLRSTEIVTIKAAYSQTLERYENALQELDAIHQGHEHFVEKKQQEIIRLQKILALYQTDDSQLNEWGIESALLDSCIVKELRKLANHGKTPTDSQWEFLHNTFYEYLPLFYNRITNPQYLLTEKEVKVCLLIKLRFIPSEIATLLDISKQRITNMRSNINRKLFHAEGTKALDSEIRRL